MNLYWIVFLLSFLIFLLVGFLAKRTGDYFQGTSSYGIFTTSAGILASFIGGAAILNTVVLANDYGYYALVDVIPTSLALILSFFFLNKKRAKAFFDATEYKDKFSPKYHHVVIFILYILVMVAQFVGFNQVKDVLEIDGTVLIVLLTAAIIWIYSLKGFSAVNATDRLQFIMMVIGFYLLNFFNITLFSTSNTDTIVIPKSSMPISLVIALFLPFFFVPISQEVHQRISAAKDELIVRKSLLLAGILYFILGLITVYIGSNASEKGLTGILHSLDLGILKSICFLAIITALISTADTALNISSHSFFSLFNSISKKHYPLMSFLILIVVIALTQFFPSILSVILLALFIYMSGPAYMVFTRLINFDEKLALIISAFMVISHIIIKIINYEVLYFSLSIMLIIYISSFIIRKKLRGPSNG